MKKYDLIVVGGGIMGTFCAYHALKLKKSVLLIEKDSVPYEGSFRNFGQGVPSGQKLDKWFEYGRKSLNIYSDLQEKTDISFVKNGSWYIASDDFETTLLEELQVLFKERNYTSRLYNKNECLEIHKNLKAEYVKSGLYIPQEASLNPLLMVHKVRNYLIERMGLHYFAQTNVLNVEKKRGIVKLDTADKRTFWSDKIILANGKDTQILFPELYNENDLVISKLQMLRLKKQKRQIQSNLLTGLTIRRYGSFTSCPSYNQKSSTPEQAELEKFGIHILFKQADDGSIILGDSHEYTPANQQANLGFEINQQINDLIINEAKKIINLESWEIEASWNGYYLQTKNDEIFTHTIDDIIHVINGIGGKGMTTSPGFTQEFIQHIYSINK
jgi:FAD dependent oxidoreductase TIGR03364